MTLPTYLRGQHLHEANYTGLVRPVTFIEHLDSIYSKITVGHIVGAIETREQWVVLTVNLKENS